jgi:hypothetical protein
VKLLAPSVGAIFFPKRRGQRLGPNGIAHGPSFSTSLITYNSKKLPERLSPTHGIVLNILLLVKVQFSPWTVSNFEELVFKSNAMSKISFFCSFKQRGGFWQFKFLLRKEWRIRETVRNLFSTQKIVNAWRRSHSGMGKNYCHSLFD